MKKIILSFYLALSAGFLLAQSQRLVFVEEFTQASCGPCAAANPSFNALLAANTSKAVSLKYQVSFPGSDPMNAQNPTDPATRITYYGATGVPDARLNGNVAAGQPSVITQSNINSQYALPSPFTIQLVHWLNAANDSIYINCEITCTQNVTMANPKVRISMLEKTITFTNAPGSNGETVFYNVMRKMYPNANGTTLAGTWTLGQKKTVSFKEKLPIYIYNKSQIGVVAWIQDDSNKNVKQAGFSSSPSTPLTAPPIAEFASDVITTCDGIVKFKDQSAVFPTSWSWDFGDGTGSSSKNPTHKYNTSGTYTVQLTATNANGSNAITKTGYVTVTLNGTAPTGTNDIFCSPGTANLTAATAGSGTLNWYDSNGSIVNTGTTYNPTLSGTTDFWVAEMTANPLTSEGPAANTIGTGSTFTATATVHGLYFDVVKPCTLVSVVTYASTAGNRTIQIVDAAGAVVQAATVNIPSGQSTVTLNFVVGAGTGYLLRVTTSPPNLYRNTAGAVYPYTASGIVTITGNTAPTSPAYYYYFYDWKVRQNPCTSPGVKVSGMDTCALDINDVTIANSLVVYPNPSNGLFTTSFNTTVADKYSVKITNTLGQVVFEEKLDNFMGAYSKEINISAYGKGIYMIHISNSKGEDVKKVITY